LQTSSIKVLQGDSVHTWRPISQRDQPKTSCVTRELPHLRPAPVTPPERGGVVAHTAASNQIDRAADRCDARIQGLGLLPEDSNQIDRAADRCDAGPVHDVRVDHGRRDIRMTQQLLDRADVVAGLEQMRGKSRTTMSRFPKSTSPTRSRTHSMSRIPVPYIRRAIKA